MAKTRDDRWGFALARHALLGRNSAGLQPVGPQAFQGCLLEWLHTLGDALAVPHIAVDRNTVRHSSDASTPTGPLHLVSAWATQNHLFLGEVAGAADSNAMTAIPKLLGDLLQRREAIVLVSRIASRVRRWLPPPALVCDSFFDRTA